MRTIIIVLISLNVIWGVFGAVLQSEPHSNRKPGGCFDDIIGHMTINESKNFPSSCASASCGQDGGISYASCGVVATNDPKCKITAPDMSKPYPECCPGIQCEGDKDKN